MSQQTYERYRHGEDDAPVRGAIASGVNWVGAMTSIGLVVGVAVWGYQLTMRDVTEVPVVRALEGPLRVQPDDPGGVAAAHQGLAVNEVQATGTVETPAERVVLAPAPVVLTAEDVVNPGDQLKHIALADPTSAILVTDMSASSDIANPSVSQSTGIATTDAITQAVETAVKDTEKQAAAKRLARMPGVKRSPRPRARVLVAAIANPSTVTDGSAEIPVPARQTTGAIDVDPAQVSAGTRLVQLGAFDDRPSAIKEWDHIVGRHGDLIDGRKRLIQQAESGGRSFYRLRMVGFNDLGDSRRLCAALLARGTPCIPVTAR